MSHGHRTTELRSIEFHRLVVERLDGEVLERARRRVEGWLERGPVTALWARAWWTLLERPMPEISAALVADTEEMRDLRQNTPFAGVLAPAERWRIIREIR